MGLLSRAGSYYPGRARDSVTVTVVSEDFMCDSYLYADELVPTSGLSLNFFSGISSPIYCFLKFCFSHKASLNSHVVYRDFTDPHTNLHASYFCTCPG